MSNAPLRKPGALVWQPVPYRPSPTIAATASTPSSGVCGVRASCSGEQRHWGFRPAWLKYKKSTDVLDYHPPSTPINPLNEHVTLGYRVD